ncbi:MAG: hypothetical protein NVSMB13_12680 [Mycobacteriales bacterium]
MRACTESNAPASTVSARAARTDGRELPAEVAGREPPGSGADAVVRTGGG